MLLMILVLLWKGTEVLVPSLVPIPSRYLTDTFKAVRAFFSHLAKILSTTLGHSCRVRNLSKPAYLRSPSAVPAESRIGSFYNRHAGV